MTTKFLLFTALATSTIGCLANPSDRSDADPIEPVPTASVTVPPPQVPVLPPPRFEPPRITPIVPETGACYPNVCWRSGVQATGICACPEIEAACRAQYGDGYEATCPALRSWARACVGNPSPAPPDVAAANACYPMACTTLREDGSHCSCQVVQIACRTYFGEDYETKCPALVGWARGCIAR